jgi:hypothetical protein
MHMRRFARALFLFAVVGVGAAEPLPVRLYDVTTETGMPHLEENLRYATRHERRCLGARDLATAFWMLDHEALQGCRLEVADAPERAQAAAFTLVCTHGHRTTGHALRRIEPDRLRGTLDVKLGGKNMTFFQRVTARAIGACPAR